MRQPQTKNWSPEIQLKTDTGAFDSSNPARPPSCGREVMKPRCWLVRAYSIESSTEGRLLARRRRAETCRPAAVRAIAEANV